MSNKLTLNKKITRYNHNFKNIENLRFRLEIRYIDDTPVGSSVFNELGKLYSGDQVEYTFSVCPVGLTRGKYKALIVIYEMNQYGTYDDYDAIWPAFVFQIDDKIEIDWNVNMWGHLNFADVKLLSKKTIGGQQ